MSREMLINVAEREECRVAVVEDTRLEELYVERASAGTHNKAATPHARTHRHSLVRRPPTMTALPDPIQPDRIDTRSA